jgi:toxin ParE1/3/4
MPGMGAVRKYSDPELEVIRVRRIDGFDSYLIFYRPTESSVEIIRVIHGKRDIEVVF